MFGKQILTLQPSSIKGHDTQKTKTESLSIMGPVRVLEGSCILRSQTPSLSLVSSLTWAFGPWAWGLVDGFTTTTNTNITAYTKSSQVGICGSAKYSSRKKKKSPYFIGGNHPQESHRNFFIKKPLQERLGDSVS